ncbi:hypothetical protein HPB48_019039 [Haemaphysalis longicornis]|uniref:Endonuclease/exonuclease/phosphatase domain-containing protein n=1 Tax=Haemaphysalis longicornis TaxID=44386 RepID=A0A9J6GK77_HAELO|nr:hypothetical protein HPB48_019039 [Haemaphysalis longicornis]
MGEIRRISAKDASEWQRWKRKSRIVWQHWAQRARCEACEQLDSRIADIEAKFQELEVPLGPGWTPVRREKASSPLVTAQAQRDTQADVTLENPKEVTPCGALEEPAPGSGNRDKPVRTATEGSSNHPDAQSTTGGATQRCKLSQASHPLTPGKVSRGQLTMGRTAKVAQNALALPTARGHQGSSGLVAEVGAPQCTEVVYCKGATVAQSLKLVEECERTARPVHRLWVLHVGLPDLLAAKGEEVVSRVEEWCEGRGRSVLTCSIPEVTQRGGETRAGIVMANAQLKKLCKRRRIPFLDLAANGLDNNFSTDEVRWLAFYGEQTPRLQPLCGVSSGQSAMQLRKTTPESENPNAAPGATQTNQLENQSTRPGTKRGAKKQRLNGSTDQGDHTGAFKQETANAGPCLGADSDVVDVVVSDPFAERLIDKRTATSTSTPPTIATVTRDEPPQAPVSGESAGRPRSRTHHRHRGKEASRFAVGFPNMNGARGALKWEELYRLMGEEEFSLYAVAETHLWDLEEPASGNGLVLGRHREPPWICSERSVCVDRLRATGDLLGIAAAACVVYLSVQHTRLQQNVELIACILNSARRYATDKELVILGYFNGHLAELDGYMNRNGLLVLQLADQLNLKMANLTQGSAMAIDYALVSPRLAGFLRRINVDEEGVHSLSSDHNRLRLDFPRSHQATNSAEQARASQHLVTRNSDAATGVLNQPQYGFNVHDRRPCDTCSCFRGAPLDGATYPATMAEAVKFATEYHERARSVPRQYILHAGLQDVIRGNPDEMTNALDSMPTGRTGTLTICSIPEITSRGDARISHTNLDETPGGAPDQQAAQYPHMESGKRKRKSPLYPEPAEDATSTICTNQPKWTGGAPDQQAAHQLSGGAARDGGHRGACPNKVLLVTLTAAGRSPKIIIIITGRSETRGSCRRRWLRLRAQCTPPNARFYSIYRGVSRLYQQQ